MKTQTIIPKCKIFDGRCHIHFRYEVVPVYCLLKQMRSHKFAAVETGSEFMTERC